MEKRILGKTGMSVSVLGFGAAEIGYEGATQETVNALVHEALDQGLNAIDTAECYVTSEEMIGNSVSKRRSEYFLFTKCGHADTFYNPAWSKSEIKASVDRSLKRLKTDYVDLLQLHSCSKEILEKGEVVEALQDAQKSGKVRFIGYSGDGQDAHYAVNMGVFDTLQTSVSIFDQEAIELTLPLAIEKNMGVIAKRPIGNAVWRFPSRPDNSYVVEYWERMRALGYDFLDGSAESIGARALRFTYSVAGVHTMIVGTKVPGRWRSNATLLEKGPLSESEMSAIRDQWKQVAKSHNWVGQV
ncbi:MAG: aldo/keto reductase [Candidatus Obscuribacter sp.]|nr:aldo/keto reductase [Candidatus Obscuribacter sp.]MBK9277212.1 aldo/keto reductase [Candidatus Obscuribacter sp.]